MNETDVTTSTPEINIGSDVNNYQILTNLLAWAIRSGNLEAGLASNALKLEQFNVSELFELFKQRTKIINNRYLLRDIIDWNTNDIVLNKVIGLYIVGVGEIIPSSLEVDSNGQLIIPDMFNQYLDNEIILSSLELSLGE
jgi:hypothetical protein